MHKRCPKQGAGNLSTLPRARSVDDLRSLPWKERWLFLVGGFLALLWFIVRVVPKPSRATQPCQRVAAPLAAGFWGYLASMGVVGVLSRKARGWFAQSRYVAACTALGFAVVALALGLKVSSGPASAISTGTFSPIDGPNQPMGVAKGLMPGRVAWVHNPSATTYAGSGYYYSNQYNNQTAITAMLSDTVRLVANQYDLRNAYDVIFRHHNAQRGRGNVGYSAGERVVIKVNLNSNGNTYATDASPHTVYALLDHLVNVVGVAQSNIVVYDKVRPSAGGIISALCSPRFPNVNYNSLGGVIDNALQYSVSGIDSQTRQLPVEVVNATYMFNFSLLKRHSVVSSNWVDADGQTAVTLGFKNHCGTLPVCWPLHYHFRDFNEAMGNYNPLVDLMGSKHIGGKTVLHFMDGLYSADKHDAPPRKWNLAPFSGRYPASLFASQDPVALDSVGLDFLRAEMQLIANADNYLHEAAKTPSAPSGVQYRPDGVTLQSLGVHEHWNNSSSKQYSRNLGTGSGIELVTRSNLPPIGDPPPAPWANQDIGTVGAAGYASYSSGKFTVGGAGADIWGSADGFQFVYQTMTGDGEITARVSHLQNTHAWAKAGVMIRESLANSSKHASMVLTAASGLSFLYRTETGATSASVSGGAASAPRWVRLRRAGSTLTGYASADGSNWTAVGSMTVSMTSSVSVGLAVTSHVSGVLSSTAFDNVSVTAGQPPPPPPAVELPAKIEAEAYVRYSDSSTGNAGNACRTDNVDLENTSDTGAGCNVGWTTAGEWLEYDVSTAVSKAFDITLRVASASADMTAHVEVDGQKVGSITAPTSGWQAFADRTISSVNVAAGSHVLGVVFDTGSVNLNYIDVKQAGSPPPPSGWSNQDIGAVAAAGSMSESGGTFTVRASGADTWGSADEFHFVYQRLSGDSEITARVSALSNTDGWAKAGVMIRESLADSSKHAFMALTAANGLAFQRRTTTAGATTHTSGGAASAPRWLRLRRASGTLTAFASADGTTWTEVGSESVSMAGEVLVGLAATSHLDGTLTTAQFDNVSAKTIATNPWASQDVGAVAAAGSMSESNGSFTIKGSGADIWGTADEFHFVHRTLTGDGEISARINSLQNVNGWAKAGVMIRESLAASSKHASMLLTAANGLAFQQRTESGGVTTHTSGGAASAPRWVRLRRTGSTLTAFASADGATWTQVASATSTLASTVYIGLAVTSHVDGTLCTSVADSVSTSGTTASGAAALETLDFRRADEPVDAPEVGCGGAQIFGTGSPTGGTFAALGVSLLLAARRRQLRRRR